MNRQSNRDRKLWVAMLGGLVGVLLVGAGVVVSGILAARGGSAGVRGLNVGLLFLLVAAVTVMVFLGVRQLDEYGRRLHQRAASAAFVVTMLFTAATFVLQASLKWSVPLWVVYTVGMLSWAVASAVIAVSDGRKR